MIKANNKQDTETLSPDCVPWELTSRAVFTGVPGDSPGTGSARRHEGCTCAVPGRGRRAPRAPGSGCSASRSDGPTTGTGAGSRPWGWAPAASVEQEVACELRPKPHLTGDPSGPVLPMWHPLAGLGRGGDFGGKTDPGPSGWKRHGGELVPRPPPAAPRSSPAVKIQTARTGVMEACVRSF